MEQRKCLLTQYTLLDLIRDPTTASTFIRELEFDSHCDYHYDNYELRENVTRMIGSGRYHRLINFEGTVEDEVTAIRTVRQFRKEYNRALMKRISFTETFDYYFDLFTRK